MLSRSPRTTRRMSTLGRTRARTLGAVGTSWSSRSRDAGLVGAGLPTRLPTRLATWPQHVV